MYDEGSVILEWKMISYEDRPYFESKISESGFTLSDYNFTHLSIWKDTFNMSYTTIDNFLVIKGYDPSINQPYILMPIGNGNYKSVFKKLLEELARGDEPLIVRAVTPEMFIKIQPEMSMNFRFITHREEYEYIYSLQLMQTYSGKNLRRKREMCNHFEAKNNYQFIQYESKHKQMILDLIQKWHDERNDTSNLIVEYERIGILNVLEHFDQLNCFGFFIKVKDEAVGFLLADALTKDILLFHYEKGLRDFKGVYDVLKRNTALYFRDQFKWVSLEEDMGNDGLRKAKLLYRPEFMIKKGTVTFDKKGGILYEREET